LAVGIRGLANGSQVLAIGKPVVEDCNRVLTDSVSFAALTIG